MARPIAVLPGVLRSSPQDRDGVLPSRSLPEVAMGKTFPLPGIAMRSQPNRTIRRLQASPWSLDDFTRASSWTPRAEGLRPSQSMDGVTLAAYWENAAGPVKDGGTGEEHSGARSVCSTPSGSPSARRSAPTCRLPHPTALRRGNSPAVAQQAENWPWRRVAPPRCGICSTACHLSFGGRTSIRDIPSRWRH
jgi:hypothetical protein